MLIDGGNGRDLMNGFAGRNSSFGDKTRKPARGEAHTQADSGRMSEWRDDGWRIDLADVFGGGRSGDRLEWRQYEEVLDGGQFSAKVERSNESGELRRASFV